MPSGVQATAQPPAKKKPSRDWDVIVIGFNDSITNVPDDGHGPASRACARALGECVFELILLSSKTDRNTLALYS